MPKSSSKKQASEYLFIFAHGAGAGMDSDFMLTVSKQLEESGIEVRRFEFPYMQKIRKEEKRRPPDRMPKLIDAFEAIISKVSKSTNKKILIGGKSMGGRVASLLASENRPDLDICGVICMGFPFHPPKKPEKYRGEHLQTIKTPTLILQGERDSFGTKNEIALFSLASSVQVKYLGDGDHSFKPRVKSGRTLAENLKFSASEIVQFANNL